MTPAVFIDTNVPIYAAGKPHPLKAPCTQILRFVAENPEAFTTDAEVLQELLHRYLVLRLWPQGREALREFSELMRGRVEAVRAEDVDQAASMVERGQDLSARDLLHASIMKRSGVIRIISADVGFDLVPGVERLDPAGWAKWRPSLLPVDSEGPANS